MSAKRARWIDAALGEDVGTAPRAEERALLEAYERTAARAHLALAARAPLHPPRDLGARLVAQGLRALAERRSQDGDH